MQRLTLSNATRRLYSSSTVRMAEAAAATSSKQLVLNLVSPHTTVYSGKVVEGVRIPGDLGEYGITAGHSPVISQLKPGLVTVNHVGVSQFNTSHQHSLIEIADHYFNMFIFILQLGRCRKILRSRRLCSNAC